MSVSQNLIDNVNDIKTTLNEISVYNLDVKTAIELYYELAKKVNEVINELSRFEGVVSDEVIKQNEKLIYLLGEGLKTEVVKKIDQMVTDGTIQDLINNKIFNDLNNKIDTFKQEVNEQFNTITIDLSHKGAKGDGLFDNTDIIQDALNQGGHIIISEPGVYITRPLKIGSNTHLDVKEGAELKLKDNSAWFLIENKDRLTTGNENITLSGKFNQNNTGGNGYKGSIADGLYNGHCILLGKVKNLNIKNAFQTSASKYGFLIYDCENVSVDNLGFDNDSDGIHFQPPVKNVRINNVWGTTGDDLVSFTLGDYTSHMFSNTGNFEDIEVKNIHSDNCLCAIKITGSGLNSEYYFKNITIKDVFGTTSSNVISILDDTTDGNTDLINTKVVNLKLKNIQAKSTHTRDMVVWAKNSSTVVIEDIDINRINSDGNCILIGGSYESFGIKNITQSDRTKALNNNVINIQTGTTIKTMFLENINIDNLVGSFFKCYSYATNLFVKSIYIYATTRNTATVFDFVNRLESNPIYLNIDDYRFRNVEYIVKTNTRLYTKFSNGDIDSTCRYRFRTESEYLGTDPKSYVEFHSSAGFMNISRANSDTQVSLNMSSGYTTTKRNELTPNPFDMIINYDSREDSDKRGISVFNGNEWVLLVPYVAQA